MVRPRSLFCFLQRERNCLRSPYAGDIRTLQAVDILELYCLQDVLVFSSQGDRMFLKTLFFLREKEQICFLLGPDCHKISGSDLDGDHYFVSFLFFSLFRSLFFFLTRHIGVKNYNFRLPSNP